MPRVGDSPSFANGIRARPGHMHKERTLVDGQLGPQDCELGEAPTFSAYHIEQGHTADVPYATNVWYARFRGGAALLLDHNRALRKGRQRDHERVRAARPVPALAKPG